MREFVTALINVLFQAGISVVVGPVLTIYFLVRFLRWAYATSSGVRDEGLRDEVESAVGHIRERSLTLRTQTRRVVNHYRRRG